MAEIRINGLANTAQTASNDDYVVLDGATNGTRKMLAKKLTEGVEQQLATTNQNVAQNTEDITDLKADLSKNVGADSANLYNINADTIGKVINSSGEIVDNSTYRISDYIYIGSGNAFTFETKMPTDLDMVGVVNVAYYDSNKEFKARVAIADEGTKTITMASDRVYIRFCIKIDTPDFMCNLGDSILPYMPYGFIYSDDFNDQVDGIVDGKIGSLPDAIDSINSKLTQYLGGTTNNLFNPNTITENKVISASGEIVDNTTYVISDFINVGAGNTVNVSWSGSEAVVNIVTYNQNGVFQSRRSIINNPYSYTLTSYESKIRLNIQKRADTIMVNVGETPLPYESYFEYCDYLKQIQNNTDYINATKVKTLTDPYKLPFVYGRRSSASTFYNSLTELTTAHPLRVKKESVISRLNANVRFNVCYKQDGADSWSYFGYNDGVTFTMPEDGIILITVKLVNDNVILNNQILDNLSINLISDVVFPMLFDERPYSIFNTVPYDMYIGQHTDTTGFNENTSYSDIISAFDALVDNLYVTKADLGVSSDGTNHIYSYTCTPQGKYPLDKTNTKATRTYPTIILVGSIHGYEKTATYGLYYLLKDLTDNHIQNAALMYLRSNVRIVMLPACVPYGWNEVSRFNANGINIDRNFGTNGWNDYLPDDADPWGYNAKGSAPFSEAETQILMKLVSEEKARHNVTYVMDIHTNGVDTSTPDQICVANPSYFCEMNEYSARSYDGSLSFVATQKPFIDKLYGANINTRTYGYCSLAGNMPTLYNWTNEQSDTIGLLLEVLAGSRGDYLGANLTTYNPNTIKLAGEQIGNYAVKLLAELSK